jgi:ribonuclease HI
MQVAPFFGVSLTLPIPPSPIVVWWRTPAVGCVKINTDGCVKDGLASGGGIIRDHAGNCISAFSASYGPCLILEAELRAIHDGILLARDLGLSDIWVEADSSVAIHCILRGGGPWTIQGILRQIVDCLSFDRDTISHIFREGNQVADALATEGWHHRRYQVYGPTNLPRHIRALLQIDRYGLPSFRI